MVESNDALSGAEAAINDDPYGGAWLVKVRLTNPGEIDDLLTAEGYRAEIGE